MKKVISIAVSTLLLGNVSFADTTNTDNGLLQSIQQKIEAKKSNLGSNIQTNSGLSGFNKNNTKEKSNDIDKSVAQVAPLSNDSSAKVEVVKTEVKKVETTTRVETLPNLNNTPVEIKKVETTVKSSEVCEPVKPVKKIVKKPVVKKAVNKPVAKTVKNDFDMVKTQNYTPVDFSQKSQWISDSQVKLSVFDNLSHIDVSISDTNGQVIPKEQFNKSFIRVVQVSHDFKTVNHQENEMNFKSNSYEFHKEVQHCGAIFVQYHLKGSAIATNLVKYVNKQGQLADTVDSSCKIKNPEELPTSLNYSVSNNMSGLFFKEAKLLSSRPVAFNIVYSKEGITRTPKDLFVYALKSDFSDLKVIEPKSYGNVVSGVIFENTLEKGNYVLGYSFNEGKVENYFKNIQVQ